MERTRSRAKSKQRCGTVDFTFFNVFKLNYSSKVYSSQAGFTIMELMIVLAVSGGLLLSAMNSISGQQQKTQFTTGVRDFETKIQDLVNDVNSGYYPNDGSTSCLGHPDTNAEPEIKDIDVQQGRNKDCIFLGKVIHFYNNPAGDSILFKATTVAGKRQSSGVDIDSIATAQPRPFDLNGNGVDDGELLNGVQLTGIKYYKNDGTQAFPESSGVAVLTSISAQKSETSNIVYQASGRPKLAYIPGDKTDTDGSNFRTAINDLKDDVTLASDSGVVFCLRDGSRGRAAAVTLGIRLTGQAPPYHIQSTGQALSTQVYFDDDASIVLGCSK